jgi:murein DD-endopeptidase MepM/ murein hydrolase activator NlpD
LTSETLSLASFLAVSLPLAFMFVAAPVRVAQAGFLDEFSKVLHTAEASGYAEIHRVSEVPALRAAVNLDPNPAKGGGDITVVNGVGGSALLSEEGPAGTLADIAEKTSAGQISIYVVKSGDTLSQIAEMFGVSVNTVKWANNISAGSTIRPGETLVILPVTGVQHTVAKGETLKSIVKKYGGDLEEVLQYNGLAEGAALAVGDTIVIPHGEVAAPASSGSSAPRIVQGGGGPELVGYYLRPLLGGKKSQGLHGYNAVDLGAPAGTPILASAAGRVIVARTGGWNGGYGNYVVIAHENGTQTLYAHNSSNIVSAGQYVVQGQVIGYVGSTGRSTGAHLHFEVRGAKNPF